VVVNVHHFADQIVDAIEKTKAGAATLLSPTKAMPCWKPAAAC
jgi:hypothetical protein